MASHPGKSPHNATSTIKEAGSESGNNPAATASSRRADRTSMLRRQGDGSTTGMEALTGETLAGMGTLEDELGGESPTGGVETLTSGTFLIAEGVGGGGTDTRGGLLEIPTASKIIDEVPKNELLKLPLRSLEELKNTNFELVDRRFIESIAYAYAEELKQWKASGSIGSKPKFRLSNRKVLTKKGIFMTVDVVGSTNMFTAFYAPGVSLEFRREFLELYTGLLAKITMLLQNYHGSVKRFLGDANDGTFYERRDAIIAAKAIETECEPELQGLRALTHRLNLSQHGPDYASKGKGVKIKAGLRIMLDDAMGLITSMHRMIPGMILEGPPPGEQAITEGQAKNYEGGNPSQGIPPKDLNCTNVYERDGSPEIEPLNMNNSGLQRAYEEYEKEPPGLRLPDEVTNEMLAAAIAEATQFHPKENIEHATSTESVAVFLSIEMPGDEYARNRVLEKVITSMHESGGRISKQIPTGIPTLETLMFVFESREMDKEGLRALDKAGNALDELGYGLGIAGSKGIKDTTVKLNAGMPEVRKQYDRFSRGIAAEARLQYNLVIPTHLKKGALERAQNLHTFFALDSVSAASEHCELLMGPDGNPITDDVDAKGFKDPLPAVAISKNKDASTTSILDKVSEMEIIGDGPKEATRILRRMMSERNVVMVRGASPVHRDMVSHLIAPVQEGEEGVTPSARVCIVEPETHDRFTPYISATDILEGMLPTHQWEFVYNRITEAESPEEREKLIKQGLRMINVDATGGTLDDRVDICVFTDSADAASLRILTEFAKTEAKGCNLGFVFVGTNVEEADIVEDYTDTLSPEDAKELVKLILQRKKGMLKDKAAREKMLSDDDLDRVLEKIPQEEAETGPFAGQQRIKSALMATWVDGLVRSYALDEGNDSASEYYWQVNDKIEGVELSEQGLLNQTLDALDASFKGAKSVFEKFAAARTAVRVIDITRARVPETVLSALTTNGLLKEAEDRRATATDAEKKYYVPSSHRRAADQLLVGSDDLIRRVHGRALSRFSSRSRHGVEGFRPQLILDSDARPARTATRRLNEDRARLRGQYIFHAGEYLKYYKKAQVEESTARVVSDYLVALEMDISEDLERKNLATVANKLKGLLELEQLFAKPTADTNAKKLMQRSKRRCTELLSIFASTSQRRRKYQGGLPDLTVVREVAGEQSIVPMDEWEKALIEEGTSVDTKIALKSIRIRSYLLRIKRLEEEVAAKTTAIDKKTNEEADRIMAECGKSEGEEFEAAEAQAKAVKEAAKEEKGAIKQRAYEEKRRLHALSSGVIEEIMELSEEDPSSAHTCLRIADTLQIYANAAFALVGASSGEVRTAYLSEAKKYGRMAREEACKLGDKSVTVYVPAINRAGTKPRRMYVSMNFEVAKNELESDVQNIVKQAKRRRVEIQPAVAQAMAKKAVERSRHVAKHLHKWGIITEFVYPGSLRDGELNGFNTAGIVSGKNEAPTGDDLSLARDLDSHYEQAVMMAIATMLDPRITTVEASHANNVEVSPNEMKRRYINSKTYGGIRELLLEVKKRVVDGEREGGFTYPDSNVDDIVTLSHLLHNLANTQLLLGNMEAGTNMHEAAAEICEIGLSLTMFSEYGQVPLSEFFLLANRFFPRVDCLNALCAQYATSPSIELAERIAQTKVRADEHLKEYDAFHEQVGRVEMLEGIPLPFVKQHMEGVLNAIEIPAEVEARIAARQPARRERKRRGVGAGRAIPSFDPNGAVKKD